MAGPIRILLSCSASPWTQAQLEARLNPSRHLQTLTSRLAEALQAEAMFRVLGALQSFAKASNVSRNPGDATDGSLPTQPAEITRSA